jgi:lysophospholipase L1-like esterase
MIVYRKKKLVSILFVLIACFFIPVLILVGSELFLMIIGVKSNYELKESGEASINMIQNPITMMISDPILGWKIKPNSKMIADGITFANNYLGLRGDKIPPKKKDVLRIVCFGDSSTYGVFVPFDNIYSSKLQEKLNEHIKDTKFEVINAGTLGYSTLQIYALLNERIKDLDPDIIVIAAGSNDASTNSDEQLDDDKLIPIYGNSIATFKYYAEHSKLLSLLGRIFFKRFDPLAPLPLPEKFDEKMMCRRVNVDDYNRNLSRIAEFASKLSIKVVFLAFSIPPEYRMTMEKTARIEGVTFVDAESDLERYYQINRAHRVPQANESDFIKTVSSYYEKLYGSKMMEIRWDRTLFIDDCHPNSLGHNVIAKSLFNSLIDNLIVR